MEIGDVCSVPKNLEVDLSEAFPGSVVGEQCVNIQSKLQDAGDQLQMDMQIQSYINTNGYPCLYYPYLYHAEDSETLTGEHNAAKYGPPMDIIAFFDIQDNPAWIETQGFNTDETATIWLHIKTFRNKIKNILSSTKDDRRCKYQEVFNLNYREENDIIHSIEPYVNDLIQLKTFGCDREFDRGNKIFIITNKEDEVFSQKFNMLGGHYVWRLTAKRFRFSYEEGISLFDVGDENHYVGMNGEKGNHQVYDNLSVTKMFLREEGLLTEDEESGIVDSNNNDILTEDGLKLEKQVFEKIHKTDIDNESKNEFDMEKNIPNFHQDAQQHIFGNGFI